MVVSLVLHLWNVWCKGFIAAELIVPCFIQLHYYILSFTFNKQQPTLAIAFILNMHE